MRPKDDFFARKNSEDVSLTFDDVRLRTGYAATDFHDAKLETRFSRNVRLKIPIVSAAMDRVTEKRMAIALAKLGGIGVIHRNLTIEEQAKQVRRVKLHLNGRINTPITVLGTQSVGEVLQMCDDKSYDFRSFPVLDENGRLIGVLTGSNIDFCDNMSQLVMDAMTKEVVTGDRATTVEEAYDLMREQQIKVLPLIDANRCVDGQYLWSDLKRIRNESGQYNTDSRGQLVVAASIGGSLDDFERAEELVAKGVDALVVDVSHSNNWLALEMIKRIKAAFPNTDLVVGNISEYEAAERLIDAGVDGIKVGQGGGSICTTRVETGTGTPQLSAIYNCAKAVRDRQSDIPVCGDGGIKAIGDIPIAIGADADSVMVGMMLAGTDESPGEVIDLGGHPVKNYRGMGSLAAMQESAGSRTRYGERQTSKNLILAEGVDGHVPYSGSLAVVIHRMMEGLRRGMGNVGAASVQELQEKANFTQVTGSGLHESHPHDLVAING